MMNIFVFVFVLILRARALEMKVIEIRFKSDLNPIQIAFHSNSQKNSLRSLKIWLMKTMKNLCLAIFFFPFFSRSDFSLELCEKKRLCFYTNHFLLLFLRLKSFTLKKSRLRLNE